MRPNGPHTNRDDVRAQLSQRIEHIDGWTYLDEVWALHEFARWYPGDDPTTVVEIGSWKGRSTVGLAMGTLERGAGRVFAIDPYTGSQEYRDLYGQVDTFDEFLKNIKAAGVEGVVEPIHARSHDARSQFDDACVNVLFVDGSHEYADVKADIEDWTTALADGAIVGFNDPLKPGVYRALKELVLISGSPYRSLVYEANTLFFRFRRGKAWRTRDSILNAWLRVLLSVRYHAQEPANRLPKWAIRAGRGLYRHLLPSSRPFA